MINRRTLLAGAAAAAATGVTGASAADTPMPIQLSGPEVPFSFSSVIAWADAKARQPYVAPAVPNPEIVDRIDYDEYQEIRFRSESAIWANVEGRFPLELFHVGKFFKEPVRIFVVLDSGNAKEVQYSEDLFTYGKSEFAKALPSDTGFAGFRAMASVGKPDWLSFLGASYFRSPGETLQYGLSARGLAIDVAMPTPEEFPRFSHFWLEPLKGKRGLIVNALLDSQRITGAYRIVVTRDNGATMDIEAHLFPRAPIERVGIGPLTSMFWYGKYNRKEAIDWRPEIHDSDGLAMWTGAGERIWRPLNNPNTVQTSSFFDTNPKGFGLLQRERRFDQYEDDGVFYERRPSVWVEPLDAWGEGAVQLVEIPTNDEIHDNIVAYWLPKERFEPGQHRVLKYRMHWRLSEPFRPVLAEVIATRIGAGGIPGRPRVRGTAKYAVDFAGGKLNQFKRRGDIELVVTVPGGKVERDAVYPVVDTDKWRATFDFTPPSAAPIDLRVYLRANGDALSETWLFQHLPIHNIL
jgi:glucans biosynthesis protein